jgi:hypothetical protein
MTNPKPARFSSSSAAMTPGINRIFSRLSIFLVGRLLVQGAVAIEEHDSFAAHAASRLASKRVVLGARADRDAQRTGSAG